MAAVSIADGALLAAAGAAVGAVSTLGVSTVQRRLTRRTERADASAALLYEGESNLVWSEGLSVAAEGGPYLRDEAEILMKNRGWLGYLDEPVRDSVIHAYEALYKLNEATSKLRKSDPTRPSSGQYDATKEEFQVRTHEMLRLLGPLRVVERRWLGSR